MLKKSASLSCSFGLFGLCDVFGCMRLTRWTKQTSLSQTCGPSTFSRAIIVFRNLLDWTWLESEFFRQSDFRFVVNFLKATEAGKGKPVDGDGADFSDRRFVQCRPTAFFMNQRQHRCASWGVKDKPSNPFNLFRTAQSMIARNQMEFDRERGVARE
jgi:hypothetical protein